MRLHRARNTLLLVFATLLALVGCGSKETPVAAAPPATTSAAETPAAANPPVANTMSSDEVCALLQPEDVGAVLGATEEPSPRQQVASSGVAIAACDWRNESAARELALLVIEGTSDESSRKLVESPPGGEVLADLGDAAGVLVKGTHGVKVSARVGSRMMTLEARGAGITEDREAVIAAARVAAERLRGGG